MIRANLHRFRKLRRSVQLTRSPFPWDPRRADAGRHAGRDAVRGRLSTVCRRGSNTLFTVAALATWGCGFRTNRVDVPLFDPRTDAERAIEAGDSDQDGLLSQEELGRLPGLAAAAASVDQNGDQAMDAAELAARLQSYLDDKIGLLSLSCQVSLNGVPLDGATVDFVPEEFLAGVLKPARAKLRADGSGAVKLADESLPGIAPGIYRVKISIRKGDREMIPARYNEQTQLGFEVSNRDGGKPATFRLQSSNRARN